MRGRTVIALAIAASTAACSSDPSGSDLTNDGGVIPSVDAGNDPNPVTPDSGGGNDSGGNVDSGGPTDKTAPLAVADLAASTLGHASIGLAWTAPSDPPGGNVSSYDIRRSKANIANDTEFAAATPVTSTMSAPKPAGGAESITVTGLDPETTYYFAIRAKDAAGNVGPISNIASATTKARAVVLLSEVAMVNATGGDFVELVVTKAGNLRDVVVRQAQSPQVLHTFADFDVALGERIVVHLTSLPGPAGFAQEDAAKSKTASTETAAFASNDAWDVYSSESGLVATDNVITVVDGTVVLDAVAYSNRDGDASTASMTAFAAAKTSSSWAFTAVPADGANDCGTQREAVAISTATDMGACGQLPTGITAGRSINRSGTTDTGTKKDWYVATQTPGAANAALPSPTIVGAVPASSTSVLLFFNQEIDAATVALNVFTASGLTITAATFTDSGVITLTTSSQNGPHEIGIGASLETIYGTSFPSSVAFCGYSPLGGRIALTEINPTIPGATGELVELQTTRAGSLSGVSVRINATAASPNGTTLHAPLPSALCVALGDVLVLHVNAPAGIVGETESAAKDEQPVATFDAHYDGAWDLKGNTNTLPNSDAVVFVRDRDNDYVDALAYTNANGDHTDNASFIASLQYAQSLGLWLPADCGGAVCTDTSTPSAEGISSSTAGVATTVSGASLRRSTPTSARTAASWSVGASSWGN